jgi:hypothetical protein
MAWKRWLTIEIVVSMTPEGASEMSSHSGMEHQFHFLYCMKQLGSDKQ